MSLFFIGCSHTYGDDLDDPATQSWPALVAKAKNRSFVNAAVSGGSNDRIPYHVIKNSNRYEHFYIAWTYNERFTRYREDNNFEINWNPQLENKCYGNDHSYRDYGKLHYAFWNNQLYNFKQWLQRIIMLQRYLESKHKTYIMINSCPNNIEKWSSKWINFINNVRPLLCFDLMNDDQLHDEYEEIQNLINEIDFSHYPGWGNWCITDLTRQYPVGASGHLLEQGHQAVADYILKYDTN